MAEDIISGKAVRETRTMVDGGILSAAMDGERVANQIAVAVTID